MRVSAVEPVSDSNGEKRLQAIGDKYWQGIQGVAARDPEGYKKGRDAELDFWASIATSCQSQFDEVVADPSWPSVGGIVVDQFGRHGAAADIRWMFALNHEIVQRDWQGPIAASWNSFDRGRTCIPVSQCFVESALKRPEIVGRLWVALVYGRRIVGSGEPALGHHDLFTVFRGITREGFDKITDEKLAWYQLNYLLLAHATGRDDLFQKAKQEQLKQRFDSWDKWFLDNIHFLKADADYPRWRLDKDSQRMGRKSDRLPDLTLPSLPFPDWKAPPPPPHPQLFSIH
jgi:hypothetical protein